MANSVDPDQTASMGAVCSGSTLFASILKLVSRVRHLFSADNFSRHHFQIDFCLGALRVKPFHTNGIFHKATNNNHKGPLYILNNFQEVLYPFSEGRFCLSKQCKC